MRVLVCGGRNYTDADTVGRELDSLHRILSITKIIEGGARGADRLAKGWATKNSIPVETYQAKWAILGKAAGYNRNQQMLDEGKPDLVIAFPGGKGTFMMKRLASERGIEVIEVN